jgi:hypothetical protein
MGQKSILIPEQVLLVRPWLTGCGIEEQGNVDRVSTF